MTDSAGHASLFRTRTEHERHRVTFVELFFDLVFVFAITQLSHKLLEHFSLLGALETALLLLAVWWVWIEYLGPAVRYWTPGLGAASVSDWAIEGGHLAERCALFIIIALGESVLVTGATFAGLAWNRPNLLAFAAAFTTTVAMWWIYFDKAVEVGVERIRSADDPGRLGRLAYTYLHLPIVAGIILSAVGDELVLAHPSGHGDVKTVASVVGGPLASSCRCSSERDAERCQAR